MKRIRTICLGSSLGITLWSIVTDISTYNVLFKTDKGIAEYCIDGILFNYKKILLPIAVYVAIKYIYIYIARRKINANWVD